MDDLKYSWKMSGLSKKVNPDLAAKELHRLNDIYGTITPEIIINEAKNNKSVLHPIFEWDDNKAAFNYRLQQARILLNNIQVTVISNGESREVSVYEVTTKNEGYKSIDTFTIDDIEFVKSDIIRQLTYLKRKLKLYKEFDEVLDFVSRALELVE
jgi:hypothetical protein